MSYKSMSDGKGSLAIQSEIIGRLEKKERKVRERARWRESFFRNHKSDQGVEY